MPTVKTTFQTHSPAETLALGRAIGQEAIPGSVVLLDGDLGTGKTVLAHGLAQGLEVKEWRGSPTFNLVHEYTGRLPYFHVDAYRICPEELVDLDFERLATANGIVAIEWGEIMLDVLQSFSPARLLRIHIEDAGDNARRIEIEQ